MALIINGERVENTEIKKEIERLRPDYEKAMADMNPKERESQLYEWSKENIIERTLLIQEIKSKGPAIPKKQVEYVYTKLKEKYCKDQQEPHKEFGAESGEKLKELIEMLLKTTRKFDEISKDLPHPTSAEIEQYYQENKEQLKSADRAKVTQIVKHVDWQTEEAEACDTIKQAQAELKDGTPFEAVVDRYSDCPDIGDDLGYIARGEEAEEFEDVAFNLGVGQVSNIFHTRYGFHIVKVYDRKPGTIPSLKEVRDEIIYKLQELTRQKVIDEFIDQLKSKARIEEV
jgi:parvulin-like peptidyl-prolyl isomerase